MSTTGNLRAEEVESIINLRSLLEHGVSRVSDPTTVGRHVAVVLLDGVCEAALALALAHFNQAATEKDRFDGLYSRVIEALKVSDPNLNGISGWSDISRLHRARNSAQHAQIPPDHRTLVGWSTSAQLFVNEIVARTFGLQLALVALADTVKDQDLRRKFAKAELRLQEGDAAQVILALTSAFALARRRWSEDHQLRGERRPFVSPLKDRTLQEAITLATEPLEDLLTVAPFVLDLGEYVWWQKLSKSIRRDERAFVSIGEAQRAMVFVLTWIQRWEAFSASYVRDRLGHIEPDLPPDSRFEDGRPHLLPGLDVSWSRSRIGTADERLSFRLTLDYAAGHHLERDRWEWERHITNALKPGSSDAFPWAQASISPKSLSFVLNDNSDPARVVEAINQVFEKARITRRIELQDREQRMEQRQGLERDARPLLDALESVTLPDGSPVFSKIDLRVASLPIDEPDHSLKALYVDDFQRRAGRWARQVSNSSPENPLVGSADAYGYEISTRASPAIAMDEARSIIEIIGKLEEQEDLKLAALKRQQEDLRIRFSEFLAPTRDFEVP